MPLVTAIRTSLENITLRYFHYFAIFPICSTCTMCAKYMYSGTKLRSGTVAKENEKFTVVCSCSPQNLEFGNFMLLFC